MNVTKNRITRLWKKMGSRAKLAADLNVTEMAIRNWEKGTTEIAEHNQEKLVVLMQENGIN